LIVVCDDVLAKLRTNRLEDVAQMSDYREVPENRVLSLQKVVDRQQNKEHKDDDKNDEHY
jgi:hypothetical protein